MPETWLAGAFLLVILSEILLKYSRWHIHTNDILRVLTVILLAVAFGLVFLQWNDLGGYLFHHLIYLDHKAVFFKLLILTATLLVLLHIRFLRTELPAEFYSLLLAVVLGLFLMTMAVNGLSMYLSIELVSIGSYLMAALGKGKTSGEGGIKYLLFGALSSAIMLYGLSLLYGMTGTLNFTSDVFAQQLAHNPPIIILAVGFLTLGGVLFKLSLVPFHVWPPDVYEAAPTPIVSFLSTAPKAAALLLLMRLLSVLPAEFQKLTAIIALVSILAGNLAALWQNDLKRLMAYSGIAQAGFMITGLAAFNQTGFESSTFYVTIYVFTNIAVFLLIDLLGQTTPTLASIAGKGAAYPFLSVCFTLLMVALVGLPPTAGFTAKLLVFSSLWESYQSNGDQLLMILLVVGLLNAIVSLFYYFKIPFYLFFRTGASSPTVALRSYSAVGLISFLTIIVLMLFFKTNWLMDWLRLL